MLPRVRVEADELEQDVYLHWRDLTKLICGENKLLYDSVEKERKIHKTVLSYFEKIKQEVVTKLLIFFTVNL